MIDWTSLGGTIAGIASAVGLAGGGVYAWWQKNQRTVATTRAEVAEAEAATTVADSQKIVYSTLTDRLTTLESDMRGVRSELASERAHNRQLVLHIWKLEGLMRQAGMIPPEFDANPPSSAVSNGPNV